MCTRAVDVRYHGLHNMIDFIRQNFSAYLVFSDLRPFILSSCTPDLVTVVQIFYGWGQTRLPLTTAVTVNHNGRFKDSMSMSLEGSFFNA